MVRKRNNSCKGNDKQEENREKKVISQIYLSKYLIVFQISALWNFELQYIFKH